MVPAIREDLRANYVIWMPITSAISPDERFSEVIRVALARPAIQDDYRLAISGLSTRSVLRERISCARHLQ